MEPGLWFLLTGGALIVLALARAVGSRWLGAGRRFHLGSNVLLVPLAVASLGLDSLQASPLLLRLTEVAAFLFLFSLGSKVPLPRIRLRPRHFRWALLLVLVLVLLAILGGIERISHPLLERTHAVLGPQAEEKVTLILLDGRDRLPSGGLLAVLDVLWMIVAGLGVGVLFGAALWLLLGRGQADSRPGTFAVVGFLLVAGGISRAIDAHSCLALFVMGLTLRQLRCDVDQKLLEGLQDLAAEAGPTSLDANPSLGALLLQVKERLEHVVELMLQTILSAVVCLGVAQGKLHWLGVLFVAVLLLGSGLHQWSRSLSRPTGNTMLSPSLPLLIFRKAFASGLVRRLID